MIKIEISGTSGESAELLDLMFSTICYGITDEMAIILKETEWDGYSGGDDAYFGLMDKSVKVMVK